MIISIIKNKSIKKIYLPKKVEGSYWISDTDSNGISRNLISIEAENNNWKLVSNRQYFCKNNNIIQPFVYLNENSFYNIKSNDNKKEYLIYCSSSINDYIYYDITSNIVDKITIGNDSSTINYKRLNNVISLIRKENNNVYIYDNDSKFGIYVNNSRINKKYELKTGDEIFILGLKLIFINTNNNAYYLAIPNSILKYINTSLICSNLPKNTDKNYTESEDDIEFELYDEGEYFHKVPRFLNPIKTLDLKVDGPPNKQEDNTNSIFMTIGPMLTMSMTSLVTGYVAISNVTSGVSTWKNAIPSLVICFAMFSSVLIWPIVSKNYEKKIKKQKEKERQQKYSKYIESKRQMIVEAKKEQSASLNNTYVDLKSCEEIILKKYSSLWQRRKEDFDFLDVSLGIGSFPMKININYPEEHFSMIEDNLKDLVSKLGNEPKLLPSVPIIFSFKENIISAAIGRNDLISEYTSRLLVQLLAYHSYDDLKIVFLTDEENEYKWKVFKKIPHIFTNDKSLRFFSSNNDEYKEVCYYLAKIFEERKNNSGNNKTTINPFDCNYLIITDCFKKIKNYEIIDMVLKNKENYGFSLFVLDEKITNLPEQCKKFISIDQDKGELNDNNDINNNIKFNIDFNTYLDYELISNKLANIPIIFKNDSEGQLPNKVGFLEMYDVGKVEQLNSLMRWKMSNPILNLQTPVGIGKNGEKIGIDLHEKYHGPHGLIAGMTGSGKSEFIITYILSMAINYHPYEVQFILIDYKGGGLAGAFENKTINLKLPHLVGTITNLDANEINRSLASIESELKRRQSLFNKAREISGESTIDIYKYQKMFRDGIVNEPISHLFIISDEFAELKNQQPEFMEQLISTARIGRSLGVHLILATQKPSGVVDPQIWSNTRFRVCLRVQDKSDSNEVIKCNDAAFLKQTGRFYFQVGYNEIFLLGQSAWAGGKYIPADKVNKTIDTSINYINNIGYTIKSINTFENKNIEIKSNGEELINIVKYLSDIAKEQNIVTKPLWLEKIPDFIKVDVLAKKYKYTKENFNLNLIVGEYDVPSKQQQKLLTLPLSNEGNTMIYGASGSGKENFITTLLYSSMIYYSPLEVNYYIIDFGSETLKMFEKCPLIGNILNSSDDDKLENLFKMLISTIEERKKLFSNYNGDYDNYCKNSGKTVPNIVVIINNYESYQEVYGKFDDDLIAISRDANKYGIYFILTLNTPNGARFKLKQNFSQTYCLNQNNDDDYTTILGNVYKKYPTNIFGRGIIKTDDVYEFQTAFPCEKENIYDYIKNICENFSEKYNIKAKSIPVLPDVIDYDAIKEKLGKTRELVIGLNKNDLSISTFDFNKNYSTIITTSDLSITTNFVNALINQILYINNKSFVVINAEEFYVSNDYVKYYQYVDKDFNDIYISLNDFISKQNDKFVNANYDKSIFKDIPPINCIIIGLENFKNRLSNENKLKFGELFTKGKDLGIINFIIIDSIDKIKKFEIELWFKNCISTNNGIWIGNGINDQFTLKVSQKVNEMKSIIPDDFCFVIKNGKASYVKYLSDLDINGKVALNEIEKH